MNTTTILLVDDLEENLIAMAALLRAPEVRVLMARSGADALEILLLNEVALALVDVQMPDMDGFELAELMRGSERTRHVPIVFVTAGAHDRQRQIEGFNFGAIDFLYKPVEPHVLTSKVAVFVELFRQKKALARVSALQNAIFNSANFSSIATDAKGVIQIFNVGAERMLGYTAMEVMNKITPADISDPQEVLERALALSQELGTAITPGFEALVFKASRGIEDIYELTYICKDGSRLPAVVSVTALRDAQDAIIGYLLIGTDNTARKLVEVERREIEKLLQQKNTDLVAAVAVADKASRAKSDFLSSMSHELRTPLNAILGFAQLMELDTPASSEQQLGRISQISRAGWHLLNLINEILDLTKIESGEIAYSMEPVHLGKILHECQTMLGPKAKQHDIATCFTPVDMDLFVLADSTRLKQVLINLLTNAIKYNRPQGMVEVLCSQRPNKRVRVSIRDTGLGLSPGQQVQLFQAFNRLGQEAGVVEGTGIGLVVAKQLVELMGGTIGVRSTVGEGSVFWVELDSADGKQLSLEDSDLKLSSPAVAQTGPQRTLLYVEDSLTNMQLMQQIIERHPKIRLLTAGNGPAGIELARSALPDVILMDINLPGINGFEILKLLRDDVLTAHIPAMAISANAMESDIKKGLEAGFLRYLTKPIKVDEMMLALNAALDIS
jgi:signal transduction histidine kinase/response regulator RpfG family c-di-GMP phosphodiesterase